jgi:VanZ family protein
VIQALVAWGPAAIWAAVLFFLSALSPGGEGAWLEVNDKVAHLGLYLVLGGALAWAGARLSRVPSWVLVLLGVAYGAADEWHQSFVPGRDPSAGDFLADAAGVLLGFLLFRAYLRARGPGRLRRTT